MGVDGGVAPTRQSIEAARSLAADGVTAELVPALAAAGVRCVLLKGPALAEWLYGDPALRPYQDADLLVPPAHMAACRHALAARGFRELEPVGEQPERGLPHSVAWLRAADGAEIDLHRTLFGAGVSPEEAWRTVEGATETIHVAGTRVEILSAPARALVVALHAAQHGPGAPKPLDDLRRAIDRVGHQTWEGAARLADELDATVSFGRGLRLLDEGAALAERLGLPSAELADSAARRGSNASLALGIDRLTRQRGARAKLALAAREAFPSSESLRWWSALARRGPLGLAAARAWRPLWLLWRLPPSVRAWRRARSSESAARASLGAAWSARMFGLSVALDLPIGRTSAAEGTDVRVRLVSADEVDGAFSGPRAQPARWETVLADGCAYSVERGVAGDLRFGYGERCRFLLAAGGRDLACAPDDVRDPAWQRVLLDSVLATAALEHGFEALHAAAVRHPAGVVAIAGGTGCGKSTLAAECVRRGWPLVCDDVLVLERAGETILAHPAPPVMNVPLDAGSAPDDLGETLARFDDEAWVRVRAVAGEPAPLAAVVLLRRVEGASARTIRLPATPVPLLEHALRSGGDRARNIARFALLADLASAVPLHALEADRAAGPARLADLLDAAMQEPAAA